jgi:hypothetical protein
MLSNNKISWFATRKTLSASFDNGKPGESRGRKAMGLPLLTRVMTAKPPKTRVPSP